MFSDDESVGFEIEAVSPETVGSENDGVVEL